MSSLRRESDVASVSQICALRLFWGFFRRWVTVRGTTREGRNQLDVREYGRIKQILKVPSEGLLVGHFGW